MSMSSLMEEQLMLETCAVDEGVDAYRKQLATGGMLPPHMHLLRLGMAPLQGAITSFKTARTSQVNGKFRAMIQDVPSEELAYLTLWYVFTHRGQYSSLQSLSIGLGREIQDHLEFLRFRKQCPGLCITIQKQFQSKNKGHARTVLMLAKRREGILDLKWDKSVHLHVGTTMIHLMIESTGMFQRGVSETNRYGTDSPAILIPNPEIQEWLDRAHRRCELMQPKYHVCVVPPRDWADTSGGGYYSGTGSMRLNMVKSNDRDHLKAVGEHNPHRAYTMLNRLQQVAWRVNKKVLAVLNEVWTLPGRLNVLAKDLNKELPLKKWTTNEEWEQFKKEHPGEARKWKNEARDVHTARAKAEGQLSNLTNTTGRARKYADYERFYFCWQLDWRGRAYPVQSFLTPQGSDLAKGLLQFADGKPLGKRGGYWLKIHLANCYGNKIDKKSFEERLAWVKQYEQAILDSARYPIDGVKLWTEAEDPWQFLAAAMEYSEWYDSGYSEEFVSNIPVGVDGSCNGLQHLSALMRDREGAHHVNMLHGCEPQDIYSRVAERVAEAVAQDLGREEEWKDKGVTIGELAAKWYGRVDRKTVKRNVMTLPYGVTAVGMRDQIVDELLKSDKPGMEELAGFVETAYIVEKIIMGIGQIIESADTCMKWIRKCAQVFNKAKMQMSWVTPIGLYVKQLYWKTKTSRIYTYWGEQYVEFKNLCDTSTLDPHKQIGGSSPNVIHSFDAAHMCMTVERCWDSGLRHFSMVHDSYGVHACDVDTLSQALRESFVELYSVNRLEELRKYWLSQLPPEYQEDLPDVPPLGFLELAEVLSAPYFFA